MKSESFQSLVDIAGPVSRETYERLTLFKLSFLKWASRINLISPSTFPEVWQRHILDSGQIFPLAGSATRWLDLGSGGGFPGLILALLLCDREDARIDLVESNRKKCGFLQAMIGEFDLPALVHPLRIEDAFEKVAEPEVITARALAPLPHLLDLASPWLTEGATAFFHKGRDYRAELAESAHQWRFDLVEHASRIDADSVILEIRSLRRL
ncbi:16S rRNA (guanine(527)-N(7))-methyltransferase RsmG [Corticibacterium sp. UT-5YL-CI-8]|nr:16S rRNA (guanine(527)-N(7))-methyltransferase RsmG [Tianweitania sp. UT-5YL-CI-8]